ncbi:ArsA family ATPase [Bradymonas sediminis]|uniref:ArsA family ATPase n=1 Tax=Bradymonas sediminis TaxID=1548548 RepID=A0A2Z4FQ97_9DELT|nr:ArsA-related P-loop ATPase [Bradymonas sediminis]AWV90955.1 ArsA family ATPase [Bradymonas sediminis]
MKSRSQTFSELIAGRQLVVCAGSGGVGKTTTSAVIGLDAAIKGRKVLVLTIDPAKRLANSLGVDTLDDSPQQIPLEQFEQVGVKATGELWAMMLDMKKSFDHLVNRYAADEENRQEILNNKIYKYFSTSLAGTQEYAAAERLLELHTEGDWDLIVLDTPPTTHALDFLEAPTRLADAVENRAIQWVYKPNLLTGRRGLGLFSAGTSYVVKALGKFTGADFLDELAVFLRNFSTMFEGFGERGYKAHELLVSDKCTFVIVTAPDPLQLDEALYFYEQLNTKQRVAVGGLVVNRVHPDWVSQGDASKSAPEIADAMGDAQALHLEEEDRLSQKELLALAESLQENTENFAKLAAKDSGSLARLRESVERTLPIVQVPYFAQDIHSLAGLSRVRDEIFKTPDAAE